MSEPTNGGQEQPGPEPDTDQPNPDKDEIQDEVPGHVYNDPTAPVWTDPTTSMPSAPTPPSAAGPQSDEPAARPSVQQQPTPPVAPPVSNPYAPQPPVTPPASNPYAPPPPAQPYGQQYPAYSQQPYATGPGTETNASAIVLTILSAVLMLGTCVIGIPSLIFGIMALTSNTSDPAGSRKQTRTGWIIFAINVGVVVLLAVVGFALLIATGVSDSNNNSSF